MINIENAKQLVQDVENHREAYRMKYWVNSFSSKARYHMEDTGVTKFLIGLENIDSANTTCGTTLCLAGFASMRLGWRQNFELNRDEEDGYVWMETNFVSPEGEHVDEINVPWDEIGAEYLGLSQVYADRLFHHVDGDDNESPLNALKALASGIPPEDIELLREDLERPWCFCSSCTPRATECDCGGCYDQG